MPILTKRTLSLTFHLADLMAQIDQSDKATLAESTSSVQASIYDLPFEFAYVNRRKWTNLKATMDLELKRQSELIDLREKPSKSMIRLLLAALLIPILWRPWAGSIFVLVCLCLFAVWRFGISQMKQVK